MTSFPEELKRLPAAPPDIDWATVVGGEIRRRRRRRQALTGTAAALALLLVSGVVVAAEGETGPEAGRIGTEALSPVPEPSSTPSAPPTPTSHPTLSSADPSASAAPIPVGPDAIRSTSVAATLPPSAPTPAPTPTSDRLQEEPPVVRLLRVEAPERVVAGTTGTFTVQARSSSGQPRLVVNVSDGSTPNDRDCSTAKRPPLPAWQGEVSASVTFFRAGSFNYDVVLYDPFCDPDVPDSTVTGKITVRAAPPASLDLLRVEGPASVEAGQTLTVTAAVRTSNGPARRGNTFLNDASTGAYFPCSEEQRSDLGTWNGTLTHTFSTKNLSPGTHEAGFSILVCGSAFQKPTSIRATHRFVVTEPVIP